MNQGSSSPVFNDENALGLSGFNPFSHRIHIKQKGKNLFFILTEYTDAVLVSIFYLFFFIISSTDQSYAVLDIQCKLLWVYIIQYFILITHVFKDIRWKSGDNNKHATATISVKTKAHTLHTTSSTQRFAAYVYSIYHDPDTKRSSKSFSIGHSGE